MLCLAHPPATPLILALIPESSTSAASWLEWTGRQSTWGAPRIPCWLLVGYPNRPRAHVVLFSPDSCPSPPDKCPFTRLTFHWKLPLCNFGLWILGTCFGAPLNKPASSLCLGDSLPGIWGHSLRSFCETFLVPSASVYRWFPDPLASCWLSLGPMSGGEVLLKRDFPELITKSTCGPRSAGDLGTLDSLWTEKKIRIWILTSVLANYHGVF